MIDKKEKCSAFVHPSGAFHPGLTHGCTRKATVFEQDKWWCNIHNPTEADRRDEAKRMRALRKVFGEDYTEQPLTDETMTSDFKPGEVLVPNSRFIPRCDCDAEPEVKHTVTRWGASRTIKLQVECSRCGAPFEQQLAHGVEGIAPGNPHAAG